MNKTGKIAIIGVGIAAAAGTLYYFLVAKPKQQQVLLPASGGSSTTSNGSSTQNGQNILNTAQGALTTITAGAQQVQNAVNTYLPPSAPSAPSSSGPYEKKMIRRGSHPDVSLVKGGKRYGIHDPTTLNYFGWTLDQVINVSQEAYDAIPDSGVLLTTSNYQSYLYLLNGLGLGNITSLLRA